MHYLTTSLFLPVLMLTVNGEVVLYSFAYGPTALAQTTSVPTLCPDQRVFGPTCHIEERRAYGKKLLVNLLVKLIHTEKGENKSPDCS